MIYSHIEILIFVLMINNNRKREKNEERGREKVRKIKKKSI